jgi:hypothetical protein
VQLGPLRPLIGLLCQPRMIYDNGEIGGMTIGKGNRSTRRKPPPVPLCPAQTPHICPEANPGRRSGKPATNRLSYGTALWQWKSLTLPFVWFIWMMNGRGRRSRPILSYSLNYVLMLWIASCYGETKDNSFSLFLNGKRSENANTISCS